MRHRSGVSVVPLLLTLLTLCLPAPAEAQLTAVADWINRLSGPGLFRIGPEVTLLDVDDRNRISLAPLFTVSVDDHGNPDADAADIGAFSVQAALESSLVGEGASAELRSRLGFELHRFSGEFDSFWAPSFPLLVELHVPADGWGVNVATGFNVFSFPNDAFDPFDVGVERRGFDAGWTVQVGVEFGELVLFR